MQPLKFILNKNLKENGLGSKIQSAMIIEFFKAQLVSDFGKSSVDQIKSIALRKDKFNVVTDSGGLKQEISLRESKYLSEIAEKFGPGVVVKITFFS